MRAFQNEHPGEEVPSHQIMSRLAKKFDETVSIEDVLRNGRSEQTRKLISRIFHLNTRTSHDLSISHTS